jgi:predicted TIM-barrel fold metal-dependent hydrolase
MRLSNLITIFTFVTFFTILSCGKKTKNNSAETSENKSDLASSYNIDDFKNVLKIDIHTHINTESKTMIDFAKENNFKFLNISVYFEGPNSLPVEEQVRIRRFHQEEDSKTQAFSTAFSLEGWDNPDWSEKVIAQLKSDFDNGANSVKTWKNIGMEHRDKNGDLIFLDNPKFDPIFKFIKDQGKVWLSHAGEPLNCWLPLDSMTVKNDQNYFINSPKYHMYLHPELPSYQEQMEHRDNRIIKNPDLPMVGLHMASLEWSVGEASKFLDKFPNANLDLAERMSHTQYQSQRDREKVRNFFIKYQNKIFYATDFSEGDSTDPKELKRYMMEVWQNDWKYFNTDEMVTVSQLQTPVQGIALPKEVVDKIYRLNAERLFPNAWK